MIPMSRIARSLVAVALALPIAMPGVAAAVEPTAPPPAVFDWQTHLAHMRAMDGPFGSTHVRDCIAMHGSMARLLGPNGAMVEMMGEMVR